MARFWRIFAAGTTVLSILLCIATIVLWVRSYSGTDGVGRRRLATFDATSVTHQIFALSCTLGILRWSAGEETTYNRMPWQPGRMDVGSIEWSYSRLGKGHSRGKRRNQSGIASVSTIGNMELISHSHRATSESDRFRFGFWFWFLPCCRLRDCCEACGEGEWGARGDALSAVMTCGRRLTVARNVERRHAKPAQAAV